MVLVPQVKITVPAVPAEFVTRANLCADLDAGAAADVALVCAPARLREDAVAGGLGADQHRDRDRMGGYRS